ncbi:hypothetical protein SDC9_102307 [bioreactor metagenome]|uniref:Pyrroline-5-carboxylate reductase catalytic N-terminal domain-containing protein n=1 Tax=bioreactor metagenome TaxID=1076179 RepID=A0A645AQX2_9ZZZZ
MKISIIGAGNIGKILATKFVKLGHHVSVANSRGPEILADFAKETGAIVLDVHEVVKKGELIIIAIPENKIKDLPKNLFQNVLDSVVVIDTGNYFPIFNGHISELDECPIDSLYVQKSIGTSIIKAFNNLSAEDLKNGGRAIDDSERFALPMAGDDEKAKEIVMQLVNELGFDFYNQGKLSDSWRQQPGTSVYCTNLKLEAIGNAFDTMGKEWAPEFGKQLSKIRDRAIEVYLKNLQG